MTDDPASDGWHLDKRVAIAMIVALAIQAIGFTFWFGYYSAKTDAVISLLLARTERFETFINEGDRFTQEDARLRINPIEQNIAVIQNDIGQIRTILEDMREAGR